MKKKSIYKKHTLRELTEEEKSKILQLKETGLSIPSISKKLNIVKSIVKKVIEKKYSYKKEESCISDEEKAKIKYLRNNSKTPSEIAKELKIDLNLVKLIISKQNYSLRWKKFRDNEKAFCGIYLIKNDLSGKIYIGQSQDILTRWHQHLTNKAGEHNKELYEDFVEYGPAAFSFKILVCHPSLTKEQLYKLENTFIKFYDSINSGYNKQYNLKKGFYDINLKNKTMEDILDFVFLDI